VARNPTDTPRALSPERAPNGAHGPAGDSGMSRAWLTWTWLSAADHRVRGDRGLTKVAVSSGAIFIIAGLIKFVFRHWELHAFRDFGLPWPAALEIFAGVLETLGGMLLIARRLIAPAAFLLAATMVVAVYSSGIVHGDVIPSLTLAPALLVAMLYLLARTLAPRPRPASHH
jgi:uncharacterized membrane protein YphA (DoxX/SURF4 family)